MTSLDDLQTWVATQLRQRRALDKDERTVKLALEHLTGNDRLLPVEQLEIYREQFWLRHTGALLEDFPGLSGVLGQSEWERLVESYLDSYPSTSFTLRDLGSRFVEHVEQSQRLPHHDLCVDMTRLEWGYIEIFDAPEVPGLDGNKLAAIPEEAWQEARILFSTALKLLQVRYPVAELRRQLRESGSVETLPHAAPEPLYVALFRGKDRSLYHRTLSQAAFLLLQRLMSGMALVPACEAVSVEWPDLVLELSQEAGNWFAEWGRLGWVVDVVI